MTLADGLRSQSGPLSGAALSTAPTCFHSRIESHLFRLLLLRRLRLPAPSLCSRLSLWPPFGLLWPPSRSVSTGGFCLRDVASRWRWPQPRCAGKLVRGSQPTSWSVTWTLVSHSTGLSKTRRLEVVAEGLPLFGSECSSPLTPRWCPPSVLTALRGLVQLSVTEWRWSVPGA